MRVPILVLALVATPFVASLSQDRAKTAPNAKSVASVKKSDVQSSDVQQQGQHSDDKCEKGKKDKSNRGQSQNNQKGQHEDGAESCASAPTPPPPVPAVGIAQIHGTVFNDADKDGVMAWYEYGLPGWTVTVTGTVTATTTTDGLGAYAFTALPVGTYTVCATPQVSWIGSVPVSGPTCPGGGIGWTLDVPASMASMWYAMIDFGVHQ